MASSIRIPAGISIFRCETRDQWTNNCTNNLYLLQQNPRLLMKGVHDHHLSDARLKQTDIHRLLRKFSLN